MRRVFHALLISTVLATSGCTIAGTAIGAATPRYEHSDWRSSHVELGSRVRVRLRSVGSDVVVADRLEGRYGGVHEELLSITDDDEREHELPVRDVVDLEVRSGSQWAKGLLLGAATDTIVVVAVVAVTQGANISIATDR